MIYNPLTGKFFDPSESEMVRGEAKVQEWIRQQRAHGRTVIRFSQGPYDGMVYTGEPFPVNRIGCWDVEEERLGGTMIQLVRHTYRMQEVDGYPTLVFEQSEQGPTKPADGPREPTGSPGRPKRKPVL